MQSVLASLQQQKNWKQFIKKSCRRNKINVDIANFFTPNKIRVLNERFLKLYQTKTEKDQICWFQNQLKAFHWFLVVLSGLRQKIIQNFTLDQWKIMSQIFLNKDQSVMEYQSIKLVNQRAHKNRPWNEQQTEILTQIIKEHQNSNKWNDIARKLFHRSQHKFFRSGKQCRQRWLNHLDPNKKRGQWQQEEDKLIVNYILFNGRRWSNIAKQLGNHRTEHMVKNRYKTLIIKQKKLTPRISNQNSLLRQIGKRILGQESIPPKRQNISKKQNDQQQIQLSNISEVSQQDDCKQESRNSLNIHVKKHSTILDQKEEPQEKEQIRKQKEQFKKQKEQSKRQSNKKIIDESQQKQKLLRDSILSQVVQDYSKGMGSVSTPLSNYQLQQIYSPFYINYQGLTPYLSTSPSLPFFMNSSFSSFDNVNQNLFIRSNSITNQDKKEDTH